jgi:hypothetical protein
MLRSSARSERFARSGLPNVYSTHGQGAHLPSLGLVIVLVLMLLSQQAAAQSALPAVATTFVNPITGLNTTVTGYIYDPANTPTAGDVAFYQTVDDPAPGETTGVGYTFLYKTVGQTFYNDVDPTDDVDPIPYLVDSISGNTATVSSTSYPDGTAPTPFDVVQQTTAFDSDFVGSSDPVLPPPPDENLATSAGVKNVGYGKNGKNGKDGALFVAPTSGGNGATGPTQNVTLPSGSQPNPFIVVTNNAIGWEIGSVGGNGGNGGDSYLSYYDGKDGGDGGAGGTVIATLNSGSSITANGDGYYGIFAYSRSGRAGNGGDGFAAPGGGTGGHSSNGGAVTVNLDGSVYTTGEGAYGIYALSVSNNGGNGGSQWGLVGESGSGGYGGSGGSVTVNTGAISVVSTEGNYATGILAQSMGGSGGSAGSSGNLLVSLIGQPDNGGNGGTVTVLHRGMLATAGDYAMGIAAQSIGGGGGSGGSAAGLIALGGVGSNGGSGGEVFVTIEKTGTVLTDGVGSTGVLAQSIGGSGGDGGNATGLVSVGGDGDRGGGGSPVSVTNFGKIITQRNSSEGIVAQSIGGGGGNGGNSAGMTSVGGSGSGGGAGELVTVVNDGYIETQGDDSTGIRAQSIGGGGGNGGSAGSVSDFSGVAIGGSGGSGGAGGDVDVTLSNTEPTVSSSIITTGDRSLGVFAQSVGGGGGNGGGAVAISGGFGAASSVSVGGSGGSGGEGGDVTITGTGSVSIQTGGEDATGVLLQSVGGGGGNGGYALSVSASAGPVSGSVSTAVGGSGGTGGDGGTVIVGTLDGEGNLQAPGFSGSILTTGDRSAGIILQSVGGGGGNGGLAVAASGSASLLLSGNVSVGIGGSGGSAGDGGTVTAWTNSSVNTVGGSSTAILAESVGGGGGNGGGSISAGLSASGGTAVGIGLSVGGNGGGGGKGETVTLNVSGATIKTQGVFSSAIVAQSVGGGGGNGGYSVATSASAAGAAAGNVNLAFGGAGGTGGEGGEVYLTVDPEKAGTQIITLEDDSTAIVAQSVGGGGGNGGFSVSGGAAGAGIGAGSVSVGLGGTGGTGGIANAVTAVVNGDVSTGGDRSSGIVVQSIGGGGGNGGFTVSAAVVGSGEGSGSVAVGLGGSGGSGNDGGAVTVTVTGTIETTGYSSSGLVAQSVGGGGGNGGFSITPSVSVAGGAAGAVTVGLGGSGAAGGDGKSVEAFTFGDIVTYGGSSVGILAQSVGGGGGNGGFDVSASLAGAGGGSGAVSVGLGGSGAGGGDGGTVELEVTNDVVTWGTQSSAVIAQSIGGGGGNGGFNISAAGAGAGVGAGSAGVGIGGSGGDGGIGADVTSTVIGSLTTHQSSSIGLVVQSVGGGGGNGGMNVTAAIAAAGEGSAGVSVGLGGTGGGGGYSGVVKSYLTGTVITVEDDSAGIVVQSLGGGGGNGGLNVSGAVSLAGSGAGAISVGLGGSGGSGGYSGSVESSVTGNVTTTGDRSGAVFVQSLGGGGGNGGVNVTGTLSAAGTGAGSVGVGIGGFGGGGGGAGTVQSTVSGKSDTKVLITTTGGSSTAIAVQSLGGGGGNGGVNITGSASLSGEGSGTVAVGVGGFGGDGGSADAVTSTVRADIVTEGADSIGLFVQSLGGGGGNGGMSVSAGLSGSLETSGVLGIGIGGFGGGGGEGGAVSSNSTGDIYTEGEGAKAAVIQSLGGSGGNGGINITGALSLSGGQGVSVGVGIGGFGGDGGSSSTVTGSHTGNIETLADDADGILVQSVGGGGGNGGMNVSGSVSISLKDSGALAFGLGGFGGDGGSSDYIGTEDIPFDVTGDIITRGQSADAVVFQSLGGSGGNGGINISGDITVSTSGNTAGLALGIGGFGGGGGHSGNVTAGVYGNVYALAGTGGSIGASGESPSIPNGSNGIIAQSLGGGGGNGGMNISGTLDVNTSSEESLPLTLGFGGFGGLGGYAGKVNLTVGPSAASGIVVEAFGDNVAAVMAQSLGGGGGNGGMDISGGISLDGQITAGVGGFGGGGGYGDDVDADVTANLLAVGDKARGLVAQSIGGGGGNGGINISGGITASSTGDDASLVLGIGGSGGEGNVSGDVTVTQSGRIEVVGSGAYGILAQSVAGGGGSGGFNISADASRNSGNSYAIGIGGDGGTGANAGDVTLTSDGVILANTTVPTVSSTTDSEEESESTDVVIDGAGILAQSVGGGGGAGGMNITASLSTSGTPIAVGLGGSGGAGGDAGSVTVTRGQTLATSLETTGDAVIGLAAQSIGGGGGLAGMNFVGTFGAAGDDTKEAMITVGGNGGAAGNGGVVLVDDAGTILTFGDRAIGLMAQSVGGGGGNANYNFGLVGAAGFKGYGYNLAIGGDPGDAGSGGNVTVHREGAISTNGDNASAILAQSVGGGGGNTALSMNLDLLSNDFQAVSLGRKGGEGGDAGDVTVTSTGALSTFGEESNGVFAQSVAGGGGKSSSSSFSSGGVASDKATSSSSLSLGIEGGSGGTAGNVSVTVLGSILTTREKSDAIFAQSVGGGGGAGGMAMGIAFNQTHSSNVGIGGQGGLGGDAGLVTVISSAQIETLSDDADGITAQSVGGGGGTGGAAVQLTPATGTPGEGGGLQGSLMVGGDGGTGGDAGEVSVTSTGIVTTTGSNAYGIRAGSIGGGGGDGGLSMLLSAGKNVTTSSLNTNIGGTGGTGGTGEAVTVSNRGSILTTGEGSIGISAQSVGGGGGNGGSVLSLELESAAEGSSTQSAGLNIGGSGGSGGTAADVSVTNEKDKNDVGGQIFTTGDNSHGIFAQSVGGGGGTGGSVIAVSVTSGDKYNFSANLSIGGDGGTGNSAGDVTVTNGGIIRTTGDNAHGIFAQSIGGGGGDGGFVISGSVMLKSSSVPLITIGGIGGAGGSGGNAGDVEVTNTGTIIIGGDNAYGIVAQSIGGGGGNGYFESGSELDATEIADSFMINVGGQCSDNECLQGDDGEAGNVTINQSGNILVMGQAASAIKAEIINGGGGTLVAKFKKLASVISDSLEDKVITLQMGADTATGMSSGDVSMNSNGVYLAEGDFSAAVSVQAIGGGGGTTQLDFDMDDNNSFDPLKFALILGGNDGTNNNGGNVIDTEIVGAVGVIGDSGVGTLVQSLGGGGGRTGIGIANVQGGTGSITFALGGTAGSGESGGNIDFTQTGTLYVEGNATQGALIQSVGGGGGYATLNISPAEVTAPATAIRSVSMASLGVTTAEVSAAVEVSLGADGGTELDGGTIKYTKSGNTQTGDDLSIGIVLQSIGAGGGFFAEVGAEAVSVTLGGTNGASGSGGSIDAENSGNVLTSGAGAHGVLIQSIGGGGGAVISASVVDPVMKSGDNVGDGGDIDFTQTGDISTLGAGAYGIIVQSLGGGGGFVNGAFAGSAGGTGLGGAIGLTINGSVYATGYLSTAVQAQSSGKDANVNAGGDITVSLASEEVMLGGYGGRALAIDGGATNRFDNNGYVETMDGIAGLTVTGSWGDDTINNYLYMIGSVDLGKGSNSYANALGARFDMGQLVDLNGSPNLFSNAGNIAPGRTGTIATVASTELNGSMLQAAEGVYEVDLDFVAGNAVVGAADRINVSGSANLDGLVDVYIVNPTQAAPGYHEITILSAAEGLTNRSLDLQTPPSAVAKYQILYKQSPGGPPAPLAIAAPASLAPLPPAAEDVVLSYDINFAPEGLNRNQTRFGEYINRLQLTDSTSPAAPLVAALFGIPTQEMLAKTYATLVPEGYATAVATTAESAENFGSDAMECQRGSGFYRHLVGGQCGWMRVSALQTNYERSFQYHDYSEKAAQVQAGVEAKIRQGVLMNMAVAYEKSKSSMADLTTSDGDRVHAGVAVRATSGGASIGTGVSFGYANFDTSRDILIGDYETAAKGEQQIGYLSGRLRASYAWGNEEDYVRLGVDVAVTGMYQQRFDESGAGLASLSIQDHTGFNVSVSPFVEAAATFGHADGVNFRPWARLGLTHYSASDTRVYAQLEAAPDDVDSFYSDAGFEQTLGRADLGFDLGTTASFITLSGMGMLGSDTQAYGGKASFSFSF